MEHRYKVHHQLIRRTERVDIDTTGQTSSADFLARSEHEPIRRSGNELWYHVPYHNERTSSFRVNAVKRLWYGFGLGKDGDIFMLAGELAQSGDFMTQARFIAETMRMPFISAEKSLRLPEPSEPVSEGMEAAPLFRLPLTDYLAERGIPYAVASRHRCRLNYGVRREWYFTVGFPNMVGGYEIRSRYFKGYIPPKDVSLIKPEDTTPDVCSALGGFMDFLSADTLGIDGNGDSLVLNSVANVGKAMKHLDGYGRIDCFFDRDESGRRTLEALKGHCDGRVCDRSTLYDGCKNLNEYLQRVVKKEMNSNLRIKGR